MGLGPGRRIADDDQVLPVSTEPAGPVAVLARRATERAAPAPLPRPARARNAGLHCTPQRPSLRLRASGPGIRCVPNRLAWARGGITAAGQAIARDLPAAEGTRGAEFLVGVTAQGTFRTRSAFLELGSTRPSGGRQLNLK